MNTSNWYKGLKVSLLIGYSREVVQSKPLKTVTIG